MGEDGPDRPEDPTSEQTTRANSPKIRPSESIGPYTILEKLGEGAMGIVYLAEQHEPFRRRVAIKVIKQGMDTARVIARFEAERQALAWMDHPSIAKIYDAGTTRDGRPYFAMEYVKGVPITEHCNQHRLSNRERLELFIQLCEGVQHAHEKAVIHRDLKPTNVLVGFNNGAPVVRIIDFGVAKAVAQPLTERSLYTELGVMIGTPEYMSPEQAELTGQDVDTRADVYSLGVMLYELLVGALPFESEELRRAGFDEIRRRIREVDPPRPSARLSTMGDRSSGAALARRTEPRMLRRELMGDLDWITMRALEKNRARRYGTPSELAADIRRHLRFEPVSARAPSAVDRTWKFARRHRVGAAVAVVVAGALLAGTILATWGMARARRAESRAVMEAAAKQEVAEFLVGLFKVMDPEALRGNSITARELLDRGARSIETRLSKQPEIRAELQTIMGSVYGNLGLTESSQKLAEAAMEVRKRVLGPEHPDTAATMSVLARTYLYTQRADEAETLARKALDVRTRVLGSEHRDTLNSMIQLAQVLNLRGRPDAAEPFCRQALETRERILGPEHRDTLSAMEALADAYAGLGRTKEAETLYVRGVEIDKRVLGPADPETLRVMNNLAAFYSGQERLADALRIRRESVDAEIHLLGREHPETLFAMKQLAGELARQHQLPEAERIFRETLETRRRVLGPDHPETVVNLLDLQGVYYFQGRYRDALDLRREILESHTRTLGAAHADTLGDAYDVACALALVGDRVEAMQILRNAVANGYSDAERMRTDPDLRAIHGQEFDDLVARTRRNSTGPESAPRP